MVSSRTTLGHDVSFRAMASCVFSGLLFAQTQHLAPQDFTAWLRESTPAAAEAAVQDCLARLQPAQRLDYLRTIGGVLGPKATALPGDAVRRCLQAHHELLAQSSADQRLVAWFSIMAAQFLAIDRDDPEGAITLLAACDTLLPGSAALRFLRRRLELDCRVRLEQFAVADRLCSELARLAKTPLEDAQALQRQVGIDVGLGRLDQAARHLDAAAQKLAAIAPVDATAREVPRERHQLLLHELDLLKVNEQYAAVPKAIARHLAEGQGAGEPEPVELAPDLQLHATAAEYLATQHDQAGRESAIAAVEKLLTHTGLEAWQRNLALVWRADLALRASDLDRASALLDRAAATTARGNRWLAAALRSELARRTTQDRATLEAHESTLRTILNDMIIEWRDVSWDGESTGFLRPGSRLRVLGELIAVTDLLHGPERALADVLEVQCCTAASRARGATALPLAELRTRVLTDDGGALVFVPAWNVSHVFAIDRSRIVHRVLPRAAELRQLTRAMRIEQLALDEESVPAEALQRLQDAARRLADALLPEEVRRLMALWRQVTITGGNLLGGPAFACLPWDGDTLLGERFAVATVASLPLLAKLHAEADGPISSAILPSRIFATLTPSAEFAARNRLTTPGELAGPAWERLQELLPESATRSLGSSATVAAWLRSNDVRPRLTVLMAHGEQPTDGGMPAFGLAADEGHPDGRLTPAGIRAAPQTGLVLLAACHAARGELRMGDDDVADSLAGAFLSAGATSVVASSAPLRLQLHTEAAAALLAALATGVGPAEALRRARLACGAGDMAQRLRAGQLELVGEGALPLVVPAPQRTNGHWVLAALLGVILTTGRCVARCRRSTRIRASE